MNFFDRFRSVSRFHFDRRVNIIMSKIGEFADAFEVHQKAVHDGLTNIGNDVTDILTKLGEIQNGNLPPEDQARLDDVLAKMQGLASRVAEIDAMHAPMVPQEPDTPAPDARVAGPGPGDQTTSPDTRTGAQ